VYFNQSSAEKFGHPLLPSASEDIHFRLSGCRYQNESLPIQLLRIDGKQVLATHIYSNKATSFYKVDTGWKLAPGIYLLKVSGKGLSVVTKIVVL